MEKSLFISIDKNVLDFISIGDDSLGSILYDDE